MQAFMVAHPAGGKILLSSICLPFFIPRCFSFTLCGLLIMKICVFCASSAQAPAEYGAAAYELGQLFGRAGVTTLFGGGGVGSMGRLADGVHSVQGKIVGIMPHFMRELEWAHQQVDTFEWTTDMAERKALLRTGVDAIVALPGGCGTFEELMEVVTLKRLGLFAPPIIVVNQNGFYDALVSLFEHSIELKFMEPRHIKLFTLVPGVQQVLEAIRTTPPFE
jgi:uncharacterized protein (TIGR00730 family)